MFGQQQKNYINAAIYLRVSTQKQVDTGYGLDLQLNSCKMMAEMKGWNIVKIYRDEGISGTLGPNSRPGLRQMLSDASDKVFDVLIFYNLDRLGRKLSVIDSVINELTQNNIGIVSCKESIDSSTPQGLFVIQLFGGLAQMNRSVIVQRMKEGKKERVKKLGYAGGTLPYGYKIVNDTITVDKNVEQIIKTIYRLKSEGFSMNKIGLWLDSSNIQTPMGGTKWNRSTIRKILNREDVYKGGLINDNENDIRWPKII